ncbi:HipA family kinase [Aequorivita flava]|uniref:HipA family kinase n=1 Tax=Aequorivita flava TaxID=3114371 RepID=A0AB35YU92_9FLAO
MTANKIELRSVNVTRYITPLREGGSLPALAEADDDFKYVLKFKGAGHGVKALIAELLGGEIARTLGLKVPELVFARLDEAFGRSEGDEEIQDLLKGSQGLNLALHFLSGALTFDPVVTQVDPTLASKIVWLDAYTTNIDRTVKNTNMLIWHKELWLIDHGATFYFHHAWDNWEKAAMSPFPYVKDHVLLLQAALVEEINDEMTALLPDEKLREITNLIPAEWLSWEGTNTNADAIREVYFQFLVQRRNNANNFVKQIQHARETLV